MNQSRLSKKLRVLAMHHTKPASLPVILYYCRPPGEVRRCITQRYGPIKYELPFIHAMALELPVHKLTTIAKEPMVQWITEDVTVSKIETTDYRSFQTPSSQGSIPQSHSPIKVPHTVAVAVIDTGVALHPQLLWPANRIRAFYDLIGHRKEPYDDDGHGTHIAGILCGLAKNQQKSPGWSPELVSVKALNGQGNGTSSDILAAMQWIYNNCRYYNIRVVNLSLGVTADDDYHRDPLVKGVEALTRGGLTVVAAAGNSGPHPGTISSPGISGDVITVGAADADRVASFSGRGPTPQGLIKPDLIAPGVDILSLDSKADGMNPTSYISQSGTSMAAPFVSRAAAWIWKRFPHLDPPSVKELLLSYAHPLPGEPPEAQGRGCLPELFL